MSHCRSWLSALRAQVSAPTRARFAKAAVLGSALGYTVELRDGEQIYVGRQHCAYCARAEALTKLDAGNGNPLEETI